MPKSRTALARFIDMSALWALCLMAWFYYLASRLGKLYPAIVLACVCAGATIALVMLLMKGARARKRGNALSAAQVRALCEHIALMPNEQALRSIGTELSARGIYSRCEVKGNMLHAERSDLTSVTLALVNAFPGEALRAQELLHEWRQFDVKQDIAVISTAEFSTEARGLAQRLGIRLIAPETLAELMRAELSVCEKAQPRRQLSALIRSLSERIGVGRLGLWALALCVSGQLLSLTYCRIAGLLCAAIWLILAAQPRRIVKSTW